MNYITFEPFQHEPLLPTPSTSDTTNKTSSICIDTSLSEQSVRSSYSFTCPINSATGPSSTISNISGASSSNHNSYVLRRLVINSLFLPTLRSTSPEDWDMDQVEVWLVAMNFGCIATNFKCNNNLLTCLHLFVVLTKDFLRSTRNYRRYLTRTQYGLT